MSLDDEVFEFIDNHLGKGSIVAGICMAGFMGTYAYHETNKNEFNDFMNKAMVQHADYDGDNIITDEEKNKIIAELVEDRPAKFFYGRFRDEEGSVVPTERLYEWLDDLKDKSSVRYTE